jgi:hypothetical protein
VVQQALAEQSRPSPSNIAAVKTMERDLDLTSFLTPEVNHRGKAYGLAMQHKSGWKIT